MEDLSYVKPHKFLLDMHKTQKKNEGRREEGKGREICHHKKKGIVYCHCKNTLPCPETMTRASELEKGEGIKARLSSRRKDPVQNDTSLHVRSYG